MIISIVIPGYNEAKHIKGVLEDVATLAAKSKDTFEIIVVDDGSKDSTSKIARECKSDMPKQARLTVIRHQTNLGKGAAAQTGCEAAAKLGAEMTVLMDGDGQHRAQDVAKLIEVLKKEKQATLVIGARERNKNMPLAMRFGNSLLSNMSRILFNIKVKDSQSGLRAFPTNAYPLIRWASSHYAMETEMLIMARTSRLPIVEVPIETIYHDNHKGTTPLDGLKVLQTLLTWRFLRSPGRHLAGQSLSTEHTIQHSV